MANARRSIAVVLRAEIAAYKRDMAEAAAATKKVADEATKAGPQATSAFGKMEQYVQRNRNELNQLATGFAVAGAALVGFAALAVTRFAEFDAAMSNVQAATMETSENMELLRQAALDAGASTVYSAMEAAGAIEELSKAGLSTADILNGGLSGALNLAASEGMGVAEAAELTAAALAQFELKGRDASRVADLLAAGAAAAMGSAADLGQALNQAGLVANQFGLSIEETVGTLSAFAFAGMTGSDAGTSFRTMLLRLANPAGETAEKMSELGINAYNAGGEFVGMANLAGQLQDKLGHLTQAERDQALAQIFGMDAIRAANVLMKEGVSGIEGWIETVDDQGFAAEQAAIRLNNLKGDLEGLSGAFETALIGMGEGADGPLRNVVQRLTDVVNAFNDLPPAAQQGLLGIIGAGGFALLATAGVLKVVTAVSDARLAFQTLGITARTAGLAIGGATAVIGIATWAFSSWVTSQAEAKARVDSLTESLNQNTGAWTENSREVAYSALESAGAVEKFKEAGLSLEDMVSASLDPTGEAMARLQAEAERLGEIVEGLDPTDERWAIALRDYELATQAIASLTGTQEEAADAQQAYSDRMAAGLEPTTAIGGAQSELESYVTDTTGALEDQTDALRDNIDAQLEAAGVVLSLRDAQRQWEQSLDDATEALKDNGKTLDITTEKGRENQAALDDVAEAGWDLIDSMTANGASQSQLQTTMQTTRDRFIALATSMGMSKTEAEALADQLRLIPENVHTSVHVDTSGAEMTINEFISRKRHLNIQARVFADPNYSPSTSQNMVARAAGGPVFGPGTATSDSIPALLSNGEHVWTAAEVAAAGGQSAMYAMRKSVLAGEKRWARGFAAGGAATAMPQASPSVTVMTTGSGGNVNLNGPMYAYDPHALMRTAENAKRDAQAVIAPMMGGLG